jgi:hypothetical protein
MIPVAYAHREQAQNRNTHCKGWHNGRSMLA